MSASLFYRIKATSLIDLLRLRLHGRREWKSTLAEASLPPAAAELIATVCRATRLWRLERVEVAEELIAHFRDGIDAGESVESIASAFGDPRFSAKLIRRAKKRNRPIVWHVWRYAFWSAVAVLMLYAALLIPRLLRRPQVRVNYIAKINADALATPESDRGWPLYRQALIALDATDPKPRSPLFERVRDNPDDDDYRELCDALPGQPSWPRLVAEVERYQHGFELLRQASRRPKFGFIRGPGGSEHDPELGWKFPAPGDDPVVASLYSVLMPDLSPMRRLANLLVAETRVAADAGDAERALADIEALLGMASHLSDSILVSQLVSIVIADLANDLTAELLRGYPSLWNRLQLIRLAHRWASYGGDTADSLIRLGGERMFLDDVLQRVYSDDGHGDGSMTREGAAMMVALSPPESGRLPIVSYLIATAPVSSRRAVATAYDRVFAEVERDLHRPGREVFVRDFVNPAERFMAEVKASSVLTARYYPLKILLPSLSRAGWTAERSLGRRDGVLCGIALELFRRDHDGRYPESLAELTPVYLPSLPVDRISGAPLRYRLDGGRPVIYSVGADRDDDAGRWAKQIGQLPSTDAAADIFDHRSALDGDWVVYEGRQAKAEASR